MKIGILGSGVVAQTLATGWIAQGHRLMLGTREPARLTDWLSKHPDAQVGSIAETAAFADVGVLAVKGSAAAGVLSAAGDALLGKAVIDTTNPISDLPAESGVLRYFTSLDRSLMEILQQAHPEIALVKAFNSVGSVRMVQPHFAEGKPTMFICGDAAGAKQTIADLTGQLGWDCVDMGGATSARAIEPLCMLWCIPGLLRGEWDHAFRLLRTPEAAR